MDYATFDRNIERFKNLSDIVGTIYYFFKEKTGKIIKFIRNQNNKFQVDENLNLISKYYIIWIKIDELLYFQFENVRDSYKIFNVGFK